MAYSLISELILAWTDYSGNISQNKYIKYLTKINIGQTFDWENEYC